MKLIGRLLKNILKQIQKFIEKQLILPLSPVEDVKDVRNYFIQLHASTSPSPINYPDYKYV